MRLVGRSVSGRWISELALALEMHLIYFGFLNPVSAANNSLQADGPDGPRA